MDFLDRFALWISGGLTRNQSVSVELEEGVDEECIESTPSVDLVVSEEVVFTSKLDITYTKNFAESNFLPPDKVLNDTFHDNELLESDRAIKKGLSLENILPFWGDSRFDWGVWTYRNRYGVLITVAAYISLLFLVSFVSFNVMMREISQGIFIDVEQLDELEKELQNIDINDVSDIQNAISDENSSADIEDIYKESSEESFEEVELDADIEDLLYESEDALLNLQKGISDHAKRREEMRIEEIRERHDAQRQRTRRFEKEDSIRNQFSKKSGNVTVSYNLKGRKAVFLEVPAYLCEGGGQVILDITVSREGRVISATVKSTIGTDDPMVAETAIWAAKRSIFNAGKKLPARQKGTMTYIFVAQ